jgi:hypothetical protein
MDAAFEVLSERLLIRPDGVYAGAPPCGRWFAGRVPHPSPTGVGSHKKAIL